MEEAAAPTLFTAPPQEDDYEPDFPFIRAAGIHLDVKSIHDALTDTGTVNLPTIISNCLSRISDSVTISNGLIRDFLELLDSRVRMVK